MSQRRKPLHKRWWVWLIVAIAVFFSFSLFAPPEEGPYGFTEAERREIFYAITDAERQASAEADEVHPPTNENIQQNSQLSQELRMAYTAEVYERYGIDPDDGPAFASALVVEALDKGWAGNRE